MRAGRLFNLLFALFITLWLPGCARTQNRPAATPNTRLVIRAARMLDVRRGEIIPDAVVGGGGDRITAAGRQG